MKDVIEAEFCSEGMFMPMIDFKDKRMASEKIYPSMEEFVRKEALLKWAKENITTEGATEGFVGGYDKALKDLIKKLQSL